MFMEYGTPDVDQPHQDLGLARGSHAKLRSDRARNQTILKGGRHFDGSAHLSDIDRPFQTVPAQKNAGQVICDRTEACDAQRLAPKILKPVDLRLDKEPVIRPVGRPAHGDDGRAAQDRVNNRVAGGANRREIPADQRLQRRQGLR